ncbi:7-deoxyloganetin glucosyltransferase-like [Gossypium australe]|uniref:7-deoxyloganetin glucosyltransferase-like n=1 Tax=Gossypium australe TaxID=47621 RepID=A0A5B6UMI2_9ROSI|nr:7-deoxyloganetin glucosyltransferase-like [Gossypium australe]
MGSIKSHAVCLPFPAQGHINPMMQLAKLLHSRGFHITFVNSEFNHRRLIRFKGEEAVKGLPDFRFEAIPDGLAPSNSNAAPSVPAIFNFTRKNCLAPFLELLSKLNSSPQMPPVTCIVCDGIMNCGTKAAQLIGVPYVQFWTSSTVSFLGFLHYKELAQRGIVPFKVLQVLASKSPNIYAIGPLASLSNNLLEIQYGLLNSSLWKEDTSCIEWLNTMEPKSVVYVNYGSAAALEWKKKAEAAISLGGSTVTNFDRMINEALSHGRVETSAFGIQPKFH